MVNFELRQLSQFVAIAEAGSYRGAAEKLFITQPALTVSVNRLEESLGVQVFERGSRGIKLTPAGAALLVEARRTLMHAEQGRQSARLAALGELGVVRVGFVGSAAYRLLPHVLPSFVAQYPSVRLELEEGATSSILPRLREEQLDLGLIRTPIEDASGLDILDVERDDLIAVLPSGHALAGRKRIPVSALREENFVMFSRTTVPGLRNAIFEACRADGFTPNVTQETTQAQTMVALVGSGIGVALVPRVVAAYTSERVCFVPLSNRHTAGCLMLAVASRRGGMSAAATRLHEIFAQRAR